MSFCLVCGSLNPETKSNRGRTYCSDVCSNYNKFKEALEKSIILLKLDSEHKKNVRGDMFRIANMIPKSTNKKEVF